MIIRFRYSGFHRSYMYTNLYTYFFLYTYYTYHYNIGTIRIPGFRTHLPLSVSGILTTFRIGIPETKTSQPLLVSGILRRFTPFPGESRPLLVPVFGVKTNNGRPNPYNRVITVFITWKQPFILYFGMVSPTHTIVMWFYTYYSKSLISPFTQMAFFIVENTLKFFSEFIYKCIFFKINR